MKYNRIRDLRVDKDYTQAFVGKHLGVAQHTLSRYELGDSNIPNEILIGLAIFYGKSVDFLLGLTDEKAPYSPKLSEDDTQGRFKDTRKAKGYNQLTTSKHLNIAQNTLSQYERGLRSIPNDILVRIAIFYDVSVDYLLGLTDEKVPYPRK